MVVSEDFKFSDLLNSDLEAVEPLEGIGSIRIGLASQDTFLESFQALVVCAAFARKGYWVSADASGPALV